MDINELYLDLATNKLSLSTALALIQTATNLSEDESEWVESELNGYTSKLTVPDYRQLPCKFKARVRNIYNGEYEEVDLVGEAIDDLDLTLNRLNGLSIYKIYANQGIDYLESQVEDHDDGNVIIIIDGPLGRDLKNNLKSQAQSYGCTIIDVFQTAPVAYLKNALSVVKVQLMRIIKRHINESGFNVSETDKPSLEAKTDELKVSGIVQETETKGENIMKNKHSIFISYSHEDDKWLTKVLKNLKPLHRYYDNVEMWSDKKIMASDDWKAEIDNALGKATIAILLVSTDFVASDFIANEELQPLLDKAQVDGTRIMPIIVRPCAFFKECGLSKYQAVNDPKEPLSGMTEYEQEKTLVDMVETIKKIVG